MTISHEVATIVGRREQYQHDHPKLLWVSHDTLVQQQYLANMAVLTVLL